MIRRYSFISTHLADRLLSLPFGIIRCSLQDLQLAELEHQELKAQALAATEEAAKLAADAAKTEAVSMTVGKVSAEKAMASQLRKLQYENIALKDMVLDMATNRDEVIELKKKS